MSTFEILIALAILTLSLTAIISVLFGNQSVAIDTETSTEALYKAQQLLEEERAFARTNYLSASSTSRTETIGSRTYTEEITVADLTPCKKQVATSVAWNIGGLRPQKIELTTLLTDLAGSRAVGGDCFTDAPPTTWAYPAWYASDTFNPGKPTALDVLDRIAYIGEDKPPFLKIADTRAVIPHQTTGLFLSYTNGFDAGNQINDLDAIKWIDPTTGVSRYYVFAAMNSSVGQLEVIDATNPSQPVLTSTISLSSCVTGSFPQGWSVTVYDKRLYLVTRETAGPELHIFDITIPSLPSELSIGSAGCKGYQLNDTVEQFLVRDQVVNGILKRYAFMATDENDRELRVIDVTNPFIPSEVMDVDLPGNQDGASLYLVGNKLYFGRNSATGPDFYVYDVSDPPTSITLLGSKDIGTDVLGIRVAGSHAFLATHKTSSEFQVWNVENPTAIANIAMYNFGNVVGKGIDYEPDFIFATGQSTPNFQMLYSP